MPLSATAADFAGGACAGVASVAASYPLDVVRVRLQNGQHAGVLDAARTMWAQGGARPFFAGVAAPLAGSLARSSLTFGTLGAVNRAVARDPSRPTLAECAAGGSAVAVMTAPVIHPIERVKVLLQTQRFGSGNGGSSTGHRFACAVDCAQTLWRAGGVRCLYRGFSVCVALDLISGAFYFGGNRYLTLKVLEWTGGGVSGGSGNGGSALTAPAVVAVGSLSGVVSWLSIYPLEVIRTRMAAEPFGTATARATLARVLRDEGAAALSRGLGPTLARSCLCDGVFFATFWAVALLLAGDEQPDASQTPGAPV